MNRRFTFALGLWLASLGFVPGLMPSPADARGRIHGQDQAAALLRVLDPDRDGTADWAEVRRAASAYFGRLDGDRDGTLTLGEFLAPVRTALARGRNRAELQRILRMRRTAFRLMDRDHDGTIDRAEYLRVVRARFLRADPDRDGTLSAAELRSPAGRALAALLRP